MPPRLLKALVVAGIVWTLPNSAIGMLLGLAGMPIALLGLAGMLRGAQVHLSRRECALVFSHWPWGPGGAITFGNTILQTGASLDVSCHTYAHTAGRCIEPPVRLGDHERAHVFQSMVLGPLFLPAYLLCGGISVRNRFERAADRYALTGRGWWPTRMSR